MFPFEVPYEMVERDIDPFIDEIFGTLRSEFLTLPKGQGFIEYPIFEQGYEALKRVTSDFRKVSTEVVLETAYRVPIALVVLRTMLGFTPPEWAFVASQRTGQDVPQGAVRTLDRRIRMAPLSPIRSRSELTGSRLKALVSVACQLLTEGAPPAAPGVIHRLDKADTKHGTASIQPLADLGVPYAMLLYERFLGRPFAVHRDSVSGLVGDALESAVEMVLSDAGVSFRKTKRAERVAGFDQAPDFVIPDEFNPKIVIEAKITEDDGTARDKVTRVQHLFALSTQGLSPGAEPRFEVVACIDGRGFRVRREDMKKLLTATRGKVFTLQNLPRLIEGTKLREFKTREASRNE